jgi:chitin synthase
MTTDKPVSSLSSAFPSHPEPCHIWPESSNLESGACSTIDNPFVNGHRSSAPSFGTTLPGTPNNETFPSEKNSILWEKSGKGYANRIEELGDINTQVDEKPDFEDPDGLKERRAKRLMKVRKFAFQFTIFGVK